MAALRSKLVHFLAAIATAAVASGFLSIESAAQTVLPHTSSLHAGKGISVSYPDGWSIAQPTMNSWVILNVPADKQETAEPTVRVAVSYLERPDHADAVNQLAEYAKESSVSSTFLTIGGWPALQRVQLARRSQPSQRPLFPDPKLIEVTTAIAAGNLLVRVEGSLPSDASKELKDLVLAIGRSLVFSSTGNPSQVQQDLNKLSNTPRRPVSLQSHAVLAESAIPLSVAAPGVGAATPASPLLQLNNGTNGELEVAVSNNGMNIVVVKQSAWITSNDGGQTFPSSGVLNVSDGDSSIAFGQSGNFYHAALACFGNKCQPPCPGASPSGTPASTNNCVAVAPSTTNGQTFGALVNAAVCPNTGGGACALDQEHIAADRVNAGNASADRVYAAVRNCQGGCGTSGAFVTCSPDGGATWAPLLTLEAKSDFPRVAVGRDGFFYVVYELNRATIRVDKFNACTTSAAQMTRASASFPTTVSAYTRFAGCEVANGFGGLDRCEDGNTLNGPTVTVDDTNGNHVYVAWANNTAANNENILVADSTNGGVNWRAPVTVNTNVTARRYHPWACATGGNAFVTWYDRRAATAANNDLTDYFAASAGLSAGNLVRNNDEFKISTTSDPQCNLWPGSPRSMFDSENCSVQPQLAGVCKLVPAPNPDPSTNNRCDFSGPDGGKCGLNPTTNKQETCTTGNPNPKYGDYDGNACTIGRLYTEFASGAGLTSVRNFFQSFIVSATPTKVTYTGATSGDYHDPVILSAILTLSGTSTGIAGQTIKFTIGTQSCTAVTSASGFAACPPLTLNQVPGPYTVTASFTTSGNFQGSSASAVFTITKEETTLSYTGDVEVTNGTTAHLSGVLLEDNIVPIAGRSVKFVLGSGVTAQTCTGMTTALGVAACSIFPVAQPRGPGLVSDMFAGDAFYLPSNAKATTFVFGLQDAVRLSTTPNPSAVGQTVRLVAVVVAPPGLPNPPLPSTPTGTVTFYDLLTPLGTVALDGSGVATLNVKFASTGSHFITASYSGDTIYVPSSATVKQNVQ